MIYPLSELSTEFGVQVFLEEDAGTNITERVSEGTCNISSNHFDKNDIEDDQIHQCKELDIIESIVHHIVEEGKYSTVDDAGQVYPESKQKKLIITRYLLATEGVLS
tara:strand:- start:142 stop:462 length:321 start_codon:yes stop_codon:yes gene_type:complete